MKIYQVDAFCRELFSGNPAAVCPLSHWPGDRLLQQIAAENNLAETAFYVATDNNRFQIRWFTPTMEVDLCGHATLASAHVLFEHEGFSGERIVFDSLSGELIVGKGGGLLHLNFPADTVQRVEMTDTIRSWFSSPPIEAYKGRSDYMLVFSDEATIERLVPDLKAIAQAPARGIIVTAKGSNVDFVSRFFGPQSGIDEDPVTGSAHTTLSPFWAERLGRRELTAVQLSSRRGYLQCRDLGERVEISGVAKTYLQGQLYI